MKKGMENKMKRYTQNQIDELAQILKNDGVISVPTDTVYGICARISSEKAYKNLLNVKRRPNTKSFPIMCSDEEQIKSIAIVDEKAEKLIHSFMPGPITLILKKNSKVPNYINTGKDELGVRMATSQALKELIQKTGSPIFMTSANRTGETVCTNLDEIEKALPNLNGMMEGETAFNQASTIVNCKSKEIKIERLGPISMKQIIAALNK